MLGFKFRIDGLYFNTFRKSTSTSLILSYSIPPYTTIRGLISNALGLKRDDYTVQDWVKIGIKPLNYSNRSRELAKILKLISREQKFKCKLCQNKWMATTIPSKCPKCDSSEFYEIPNYKQFFSSAPMFKEFLFSPAYEIFIAGENDKIGYVYNALLQPDRPLYLGGSDELVDIEVSNPIEIQEVEVKEISGILEGIHENCLVEKIPYKFIQKGKDFSLEYKTVSIPQDSSISLNEEIACFRYNGDNIWLI
ncbi:MAG: CRISPR-associated protein Cas5 [Candidatus Methanoperedenaceae archaeon]|nr:MAG: CRISPR-associated protein Cas5 [Candidatus Methanoperedenaceae archaeon]